LKSNANIFCLVRFRPEQISAVTDSVPEQRQPNRKITNFDSKKLFHTDDDCTVCATSIVSLTLVDLQQSNWDANDNVL